LNGLKSANDWACANGIAKRVGVAGPGQVVVYQTVPDSYFVLHMLKFTQMCIEWTRQEAVYEYTNAHLNLLWILLKWFVKTYLSRANIIAYYLSSYLFVINVSKNVSS